MIQARDALVSNVSLLVVRTAPQAVTVRQVEAVIPSLDIADTNDTIDVLENTNVAVQGNIEELWDRVGNWDLDQPMRR